MSCISYFIQLCYTTIRFHFRLRV